MTRRTNFFLYNLQDTVEDRNRYHQLPIEKQLSLLAGLTGSHCTDEIERIFEKFAEECIRLVNGFSVGSPEYLRLQRLISDVFDVISQMELQAVDDLRSEMKEFYTNQIWSGTTITPAITLSNFNTNWGMLSDRHDFAKTCIAIGIDPEIPVLDLFFSGIRNQHDIVNQIHDNDIYPIRLAQELLAAQAKYMIIKKEEEKRELTLGEELYYFYTLQIVDSLRQSGLSLGGDRLDDGFLYIHKDEAMKLLNSVVMLYAIEEKIDEAEKKQAIEIISIIIVHRLNTNFGVALAEATSQFTSQRVSELLDERKNAENRIDEIASKVIKRLDNK